MLEDGIRSADEETEVQGDQESPYFLPSRTDLAAKRRHVMMIVRVRR